MQEFQVASVQHEYGIGCRRLCTPDDEARMNDGNLGIKLKIQLNLINEEIRRAVVEPVGGGMRTQRRRMTTLPTE